MASLSPREQRTIRIAAVGVALYLGVFYGVAGLKRLETGRADYQQLLQQASDLQIEAHRHETQRLLLEKLRQKANLNPATIDRASLAGQASDAIQKAAQASGVKLGPIRESPGSAVARELATMQFEGTGPVAAVMTLLHRFDSIGYPLIVDSLQIDPDPKKPGTVKLVLRAILLDYDQWLKRKESSRHV